MRLRAALRSSRCCASPLIAPSAPAEQRRRRCRTTPVARSIVEKADQIRFPQEGFEVDVAITRRPATATAAETRKYRVLSKGNENTVVMVTEPASERGQIMLMKGRDLWVFLPSVSQPVRLSLAQRLTGQVANGDLARANFAGDYNPALLRNGEGRRRELSRARTHRRRSRRHLPSRAVLGQASRTTGRTRPSSIRFRIDCSRPARYENFEPMAGSSPADAPRACRTRCARARSRCWSTRT